MAITPVANMTVPHWLFAPAMLAHAQFLTRRILVAPILVALICLCAPAQKPPEEEKPQVLEMAPEAPDFVILETARLGFLQLPIERSGLLSRQVEESMKSLRKLARKQRVVRITAWVGGAGDVRRVSMNIRELLSKWKIAIPAITVIRVGALPDRASRVVFDVEVEEQKPENPHGLIYLAGARVESPSFKFDIGPEMESALDALTKRLEEEGAKTADTLSTRCFVSLTQDLQPLESTMRRRFPGANVRLLQSVRASPNSYANCDLVARLSAPPQEPFEAKVVTLGEGRPPITSLVKINTPRMILSSAQLGFRATDADLALAFERLENTLQAAGSSLEKTAQLSILAQSPALGLNAEAQGRKYLNPRYDPAILRQTIEGLPALDATISLDAVAAVP